MPKELPPIGKLKPDVLELGQFWRYNRETFCFKPECTECQWEKTCEREETTVKVGPGVNIRRAFRARPGYKIVAVDYRGIEYRIAAQLSQERFWLDAFNSDDADLHTRFAKVAFKTESPTKEQRDQAKCANFGNLFLGTAYTLERQSDLTLPEAIFIHRQWWEAVPTYKRWTENQLKFAKENKYVKTHFGRRRQMADLIKKAEEQELYGKRVAGKSGWGFVHRTSVNSPVQGCLRPEVKVLTDEGYISIGDLWGRQERGENLPNVWTGNKFAKFTVLNRGNARFVNLHIKRRGLLKCDERHEVKVLTDTGWEWKKITDLRIGEEIAIARPKLVDNEKKPEVRGFSGQANNATVLNIDLEGWAWNYFVGFVLGDGCFGTKETGYWVSLTTGESEEKGRRLVEKALKELGYDAKPHWRKNDEDKARLQWSISCKALGEALVEEGLEPNCGARNKKIPQKSFTRQLKARKALLQGLFNTDGTKGKVAWEWGWHSSSRDLIESLYLFLRTLGVDSRFSETGEGNWKLDVSSKEGFSDLLGIPHTRSRFVNGGPNIPKHLIGEAVELLFRKSLGRSDQVLRSRLKGGGTTRISTLERILDDLPDEFHYYEKIEALDFLEEEGDTFTLSVVDHYHQFDSEGVISKNTAADLMKIAMVRVVHWIRKEGLQDDIRLMLTVHDELVFEIKDGPEFFTLCTAVAERMCPEVGWDVPIEVDLEVGDNWALMQDINDLKKERGLPDEEKTQEGAEEKAAVPEKCVMVINTRDISAPLAASLRDAMLKASNVNGSAVLVPLKIKMAGAEYRSGTQLRVDEPTLRNLVSGIREVSFEDIVGVSDHSAG